MIQPCALFLCLLSASASVSPADDPPSGFTALFNGVDLTGWKGLVADPKKRAGMSPEQLADAQAKSDAQIAKHWRAEDGEIVNDGKGPHLCTAEDYGDFELWLDYKISAGADSGIYLRGSPQVQIWDPVNGIDQAKVGSGGLYNNQKNPSKPLAVADRPVLEWNTFYIRMVGERVKVVLNDVLVVDDVRMENYWDRSRPIYPTGQIELQTHGGEIRFRNLFLREIPTSEADAVLATGDEEFEPLFNGADLSGWIGDVGGYEVDEGVIRCQGGNLLTAQEYSDFVLRFEFLLPPGGNNGLAVRSPPKGDAAYVGMELQILDNSAEKYAALKDYQYHGSAYGIRPAARGYQRPVMQWNYQEVRCEGTKVQVTLNGTRILDFDLAAVEKPADERAHPGMHRTTGHLGFCGHGAPVEFRAVRILDLASKEPVR